MVNRPVYSHCIIHSCLSLNLNLRVLHLILYILVLPTTSSSTEGSCPRVAEYSGNIPHCYKFPECSETAEIPGDSSEDFESTLHTFLSTESPAGKAFKPEGPSRKASLTPSPTRNLPPLEDATGDSLDQQLPTFNEFHAMLSEDTARDTHEEVSDVRPESFTTNSHSVSSAQEKTPSTTILSDGSAQLNSSVGGAQVNSDLLNHSDSSGNQNPNVVRNMVHEGTVSQASPHQFATDDASPESHTIQSDGPSLSHKGDSEKIQTPRIDTPTLTLRRNVAAIGCFAKMLEASKAMKNPDSILNDNNDEYMNVPCSAEKWFVIETCEPVQLREIEIANYELFSSRVKTFRVFVSDRYPVKSWDLVGTFIARDLKGLQSFQLRSDKLIKFVKFELIDHHGSEHYCPLTMVRLFGRVADDLDEEEDLLPPQTPLQPIVGTQAVDFQINSDEIGHNASISTLQSESRENISHSSSVVNASKSPVTVENVRDTVQLNPVNSVDVQQSIRPAPAPSNSGQPSAPNDSNEKCVTDSARTCQFQGETAESKMPHDSASDNVRDGNLQGRFPGSPSIVSQIKSVPPTNAVYPVTNQYLPDDSLFGRVKGFFTNVFRLSFSVLTNSTGSLDDPTSYKGQYNLSRIPICPHHLTAIDTLLYYNLLSTSGTHSSTSVDLPHSKRHSLLLLASCFEQLNRLVHTIDGFVGNSPIAVRDRVLTLPVNNQPSIIPHCFESGRLLNLTFFNGYHPCQSAKDPLWNSDFSILELFVAFQYRTQLNPVTSRFQCASGWWGKSGQAATDPKELSELQPMCPSLPDFVLSSSISEPYTKHPVNPPPRLSSENLSGSAHLGGTSVAGDQVHRQERVVPGALAGSRKDTALMRLNNRVRLLERNVSVSMRYLEELSQSYRRQMERLSRSFNLTVAWLKATAHGAEERDQMQQVRITELEKRLDELLARVRLGFNVSSDPIPDLPLTNLSGSSGIDSLTPPAPPLPNFDPQPDWGSSPNYDVWSHFAEEMSDSDGIVETEDDCLVVLSQRVDGFPEDGQRNNPAHMSLSYDRQFPVHSQSWRQFLPWMPSVFSSENFLSWKMWMSEWSEAHRNILWTSFLVLLHFGFAFISHFIIYVIWMRPKYLKLLEDHCVAYRSQIMPLDYRFVRNHKNQANGSAIRDVHYESFSRTNFEAATHKSHLLLSCGTSHNKRYTTSKSVNASIQTDSKTVCFGDCPLERPHTGGAPLQRSLHSNEYKRNGSLSSIMAGSTSCAIETLHPKLDACSNNPPNDMYLSATAIPPVVHAPSLSKSARRRRKRQIRAKLSSAKSHRT